MVVVAYAAHLFGYVVHRLVWPEALATVERHVALYYETVLEERIEAQAYPMVDYAVAEVGGEDFAELGITDEEARGG